MNMGPIFAMDEEAFLREAETLVATTSALPGHEWALVKERRGAYLQQKRWRGSLCWELQVCHSAAFAVPVLWLRAADADGRLASAQELWDAVDEQHRGELAADPWTAITQAVHPIRNEPWFNIHPCKTAQLMSELGNAVETPLLSWLSVFLAILGFELPLHVFRSGDK